jgi:hypothetical protein
MSLFGVAVAATLFATATPALAERADEGTEPARPARPIATADGAFGIESNVRRALESLGRLRLHPGRDAEDTANTARDRSRPAERPAE